MAITPKQAIVRTRSIVEFREEDSEAGVATGGRVDDVLSIR
jgi:hypothetical protein